MIHLILILVLLLSVPLINKKYPIWIFSYLILLIFLSLRYDFGPDYMEYQNIFNAIKNGVQSWGQSDLLYKQLNLMMPNFYTLIAVLSLFYILTIFYLINSNFSSQEYWFPMMILLINPYLLIVHQSSIRQTIAICIIIYATKFLCERNLVMYLILVCCATGFHASAIVMLPFYLFVTKDKLKPRDFLVIGVVLALLLFTPVFNIVINELLVYLPYHYTLYFENGLQNSLRATIISSFFFFLVLFNINKLKDKEIIYGKLSLVSTIIAMLAIRVSMVTRIGMYFDIFMIVSIPHIFSRIKRKYLKQVLFSVLILIYLLRYYSFFTNPMWFEKFGHYRMILNQ